MIVGRKIVGRKRDELYLYDLFYLYGLKIHYNDVCVCRWLRKWYMSYAYFSLRDI